MFEFLFGSKRKRVRRRSTCKVLRSRRKCGGNPNCLWRKRRGCVRRRGVGKGVVYQGPMMAFGR